jgi:hypothetical protein
MEQKDGLKIVGQLDASIFDMRSNAAQRLEQRILALIADQSLLDPALYRARYQDLVSQLRHLPPRSPPLTSWRKLRFCLG